MFYGEEDSDFQNLPPEMIVEVLSLVDLKGKQTTRSVCRRWRWILDHPNAGLVCFKEINGKMNEDSVRCLLKSELYFDHLVLKDLDVTWPSMTYTRNKFPPIRKLILESGNSHQSVMTILQYGCAQTESLTLDYTCFSLIRLDGLPRVMSGMRWNHLTELTLKVIPHTAVRIKFLEKSLKNSQENIVRGMELILKKARIPNLRVLNLEVYFWFGTDELICAEIVTMMSNFLIFLEHHSKTLKELNLLVYSNPDVTILSQNITAPLFSAEQQKSVARDLKLDCLDIATTHFDSLVHLVPPCVLELVNLTNLTWHPAWNQSWSLPGGNSEIWIPIITPAPKLLAPPGTAKPMQALVQRNLNTLTNVTITFIPGDVDADPFQLSWLESCPHLTELTINNCDKFVSFNLQLLTVRKLGIGLIQGFQSIEDMSIWISRTFRNLETVQFSVFFPAQLQNWEFDWIQNLLVLPRLGEIRFGFGNLFRNKESLNCQFIGPNLIRQYCSDKARLMFRGDRQRGPQDDLLPSGPCFIKILPIQNRT